MTTQADQTTPAAERTCTGPCGRTLPVDAEHFYRQSGGDGFTARCKACVKARTAEQKAERRRAARELRRPEREAAERVKLAAAAAVERAKAAPPGMRRCTGCGRELPADTEHFHRHGTGKGGLRARCRECVAAERRERRTGRPAALVPSPHRATRPESPQPPRPDASSDALTVAGDALADLLAELPSVPLAPGAAARRARAAKAADAAVVELERPPFDAGEVFLDMAEDAADVDALGADLRRLGWSP